MVYENENHHTHRGRGVDWRWITDLPRADCGWPSGRFWPGPDAGPHCQPVAAHQRAADANQGDFGCGDEDPTEDCPIDTWVYVLIAIIIFLGIYHWWKKKNELILELKT